MDIMQIDMINDAKDSDYHLTVLLVDDQEIIGERIGHILSSEKDIAFHYVNDPSLAVQSASELKPTVILQDLFMPGVDGLTLIKQYRSNPSTSETPLIMLTNEEDPEIKAQSFSLGANDYLIKVPDKIELIARIRHHSKAYINQLQRNEAYLALEKSRKALISEMAEAAEYVKSLLPGFLDSEVKTNWRFIPSLHLGGDSFNYHWIDDDNLAVYLIDVSGHGVKAALLSVTIMNILRSQTLPGVDFHRPDEVLNELNRNFQMELHNNMFFTIWYGVYNKATRIIECSSAGHPPAVLFTGDSPENVNFSEISCGSMFIGGEPDTEYLSASYKISNFGRLYIFSDGVYEIQKPDGNIWTLEEFMNTLKNLPKKASSFLNEIISNIREIKGNESFSDDFSLIEIRFF